MWGFKDIYFDPNKPLLVAKNSPANAGDARDVGLIPGSGRSPGEGNGNPVQYSCLENPMDRGTWLATVHGVAKGQTRLSRAQKITSASLSHPSLQSLGSGWVGESCRKFSPWIPWKRGETDLLCPTRIPDPQSWEIIKMTVIFIC